MVNLRDSDGRSLYFSNRKEYYRRRRISESLKKKSRISSQRPTIKKRIRKQVTFNSDYSISLRAIQINGDATLQELETALKELLNSEPNLTKIPFTDTGLEEEEIDDLEDRRIPDGEIMIELNIRGSTTLLNI